MQDVYARIALIQSESVSAAEETYNAFISNFKDIVSTSGGSLISLYNTSTLKKAQSLDKFMREVIKQTIYPSQLLLDNLTLINAQLKQYTAMQSAPSPSL